MTDGFSKLLETPVAVEPFEGDLPTYCYDGPTGSDPHAIVLMLNREDRRRWDTTREAEWRSLSVYETGTFVEVTDQTTGKRWKVASAPCGLGCHCAAVAVPA